MRSLLAATLLATSAFAVEAEMKPSTTLNEEIIDACKENFSTALAELEFPTKALNNLTIDVCLKQVDHIPSK